MATRTRAHPFDGVLEAPVDGTALAYRERGDGEPVVFVHGSVGDLRSYEGQLDRVGARFRAIAYSRRYARPNQPDVARGADDQLAPHVDDLVRFLEATRAAPAHLVGHSFGAFACLLTAIRHPDAVRSLVLEEPPALTLFASMPPRPRELAALLVRRPRTALAIALFGARAIEPAKRAFARGDDERGLRTFATGVLGRERQERMPAERREQMRANLAALREQLLGAGFPQLSDDELRRVPHPALLVGGEQSPPVFARVLDRLEALLPNAERIELEGTSHQLHEERPDAFAAAVLAFLERRAA